MENLDWKLATSSFVAIMGFEGLFKTVPDESLDAGLAIARALISKFDGFNFKSVKKDNNTTGI